MKKLLQNLSILAIGILLAGYFGMLANAAAPYPVGQGGSGKATLTPYAIITGGTTQTAQVQQLSIGSANQVLVSNGAGALPTFQTLASSGATSVSNADGTLTVSPTTGAVVASLNLGNANTWTAIQTFSADVRFSKTITATGTNGAQTINKNSGSVNFAASASSLVVTDSLVTASSICNATVGSNDATMTSVQCVAGSGSFTLYAPTPPTAASRVNFLITN